LGNDDEIRPFFKIPSPKINLKKNRNLKIDNSARTVSHGKYMKYVSHPWPPVVAAHYRNKFA